MRWTGPEELRPFLVEIDSIAPDPDNIRVHDDRNRAVVRQLLEAHGQMQVLTIYEGAILTGNARHVEMKALGWTHVAVVDLTLHFATRDQARAYAIADNRTGELGEWHTDKLGKQLDGLPDWAKAQTGFSPAEWKVKQSVDWAKPAAESAPTEHTFKLTADQYAVLERAVAKVRDQLKDPSLSRGRCLEIVSASFCNENNPDANDDAALKEPTT